MLAQPLARPTRSRQAECWAERWASIPHAIALVKELRWPRTVMKPWRASGVPIVQALIGGPRQTSSDVRASGAWFVNFSVGNVGLGVKSPATSSGVPGAGRGLMGFSDLES